VPGHGDLETAMSKPIEKPKAALRRVDLGAGGI
jgi:hypothetical protein